MCGFAGLVGNPLVCGAKERRCPVPDPPERKRSTNLADLIPDWPDLRAVKKVWVQPFAARLWNAFACSLTSMHTVKADFALQKLAILFLCRKIVQV